MRFLRAACAGVAGAGVSALLLIPAGIGWELADALPRERLFLCGADAVLCGWIAALLAALAPRTRADAGRLRSAAFWIGAALGLAGWSWIAAGAALAITVGALAGTLPRVLAAVVPAGALLHLVAPAALWAIPPERGLLPLRDPPPALPPADAAAAAGAPVSEARPDVLLIVADTLRADVVLEEGVPTPALDALRARGTWAPHAIAPCNQTLPSHMALLAALDIEKTGMRSNDSRWPERGELQEEWGARFLAERFRDAGWRTAGVGGNPLLESGPSAEEREQPLTDGIEAWQGMQRVDYVERLSGWSERRLLLGWLTPRGKLEFLVRRMFYPHELFLERTNTREGERTLAAALALHEQLAAQPNPYFLFLNIFDPHTPYAAPPPFAGTIAAPADMPAGYGELPGAEFRMRVAVDEGVRRDGRAVEEFAAEIGFLRDLYREEVAYLDSLLARLLERVEATGRPTLILFVGDHGEAFGEHDNLEHRWTLHEEELRVPFVLAGPGVPRGRELGFAPELVDGARTLLELCGLADAAADGRNVLAARAAEPAPGEEPLAFMVFRASVRAGRWKLVSWVSYGEHETAKRDDDFSAGAYDHRALALYDLVEDPGERRNLLAEGETPTAAAQAALAGLRGRLDARMAKDFFPYLKARRLTSRQAEQLAALGYTD